MSAYKDSATEFSGTQFTSRQVRASRRVPAVRLTAAGEGASEHGGFAHIEAGSVLSLCGAGYDEQTIKVRLNDEYYYVFRADLLLARAGGN
jgi:hypothetical protein